MTEREQLGLRERKKRATREALSWAAMRLAAERGLGNITVDEIAAAAGVSPRTFNNYFPSKEAAIVAIGTDRADNIAADLRATPPEVPLWDAVTAAVLTQYDRGTEPNRDYVARANLVGEEPALRDEWFRAHASVEPKLAEAIAERLGISPTESMFPLLMAGVVMHATRCAITYWRAADTTSPLYPLIERALAELRAGLPAPDAG